MAILKPAFPYVSDVVAHIFYYTQHMATVHVENGKMHIHKEIVDNAKKEASQKELPSAKKDKPANDHISLQQKEPIPGTGLKKLYQIPPASTLLYNYLPGDYPPPRA